MFNPDFIQCQTYIEIFVQFQNLITRTNGLYMGDLRQLLVVEKKNINTFGLSLYSKDNYYILSKLNLSKLSYVNSRAVLY